MHYDKTNRNLWNGVQFSDEYLTVLPMYEEFMYGRVCLYSLIQSYLFVTLVFANGSVFLLLK